VLVASWLWVCFGLELVRGGFEGVVWSVVNV